MFFKSLIQNAIFISDESSPRLLCSLFTRMAFSVPAWSDFGHAHWGLLRKHYFTHEAGVRFSWFEFVYSYVYHVNLFLSILIKCPDHCQQNKNEARTSTSLSVNIINNKSSYVIFDCTLYAFLFRAFRRRGTEEIKYHDTKKGACYKIQTGEGTYDDKNQSNAG